MLKRLSFLVPSGLQNALGGLRLKLVFYIRDSMNGSYNSLGGRCEPCLPGGKNKGCADCSLETQLSTAESEGRAQQMDAVQAWPHAAALGRAQRVHLLV